MGSRKSARTRPIGRRWLAFVAGGVALGAVLLSLRTLATADEGEVPGNPEVLAGLLELVIDVDAETARQCLSVLRQKVQQGELDAAALGQLKTRLQSVLAPVLAAAQHAVHVDAVLLAAAWRDEAAVERAVQLADRPDADPGLRADAIAMLLIGGDKRGLERAGAMLRDPRAPAELHSPLLDGLARSASPEVADRVLEAYPDLDPALQPRAIELLAQRTMWAKALLDQIELGRLPAHVLNVNQIARLQDSPDRELRDMLQKRYGIVRAERNPARELVIREVRAQLVEQPGDPQRGWDVFRRVCGQCHRIYGEGQDVGPDLTRNGRGSLPQLLSNMLDPSLVIGAAYQARIVATADGRVLTGLPAEDNEQRVVLKLQGGVLEVIPRENIDEIQVSPLSLMPEGLERQLPARELFDLLAFLRLDKPPTDPSAERIPDEAPAAP